MCTLLFNNLIHNDVLSKQITTEIVRIVLLYVDVFGDTKFGAQRSYFSLWKLGVDEPKLNDLKHANFIIFFDKISVKERN